MEQELVGIQIQIAGKNYPLKVTASEATTVKEVETHINEKISYLQKTYPFQEKDSYISMAFFAYAMDAEKKFVTQSNQPTISQPIAAAATQTVPAPNNTSNNLSDELIAKITELDRFLDQVLG